MIPSWISIESSAEIFISFVHTHTHTHTANINGCEDCSLKMNKQASRQIRHFFSYIQASCLFFNDHKELKISSRILIREFFYIDIKHQQLQGLFSER